MAFEHQPDAREQPFHQRLTGAQITLFAFICSLLGDEKQHAHDVLQETNLVLWKKAEEFDPSQKFIPWALRFAHMQVRAFRLRQSRDRLTFGDELVDALAAEFSASVPDAESRLEALDQCLSELTTPHRSLIRQYYDQGRTLSEIGQAMGAQASAVAAALYRIRKKLFRCIEHRLRLEGAA